MRVISFCALLTLLLLPACAVRETTATSPDAALELRTQLAQLDALPRPAGADPQVWEGLKAALRTMLEQRITAGRAVSKTTTVDRSRAPLSFDESTGTLSWGFYNSGDYNQDGEVNISDLTPLGVHFNKSVPAGEPDSIEAVVDGNGDGLITISDLSPLGASIGSRVLSYNVYTSADDADYPADNAAASAGEPLGTVALAQSTGTPTQERRRFSFTVDSPLPDAYYWVRPCDKADGSRLEGTPSELIGGAFNAPPVARLELCPFSGPAPLEVTPDASGSTDSDGTIELYRWDWNGDGTVDQETTDALVTHTYDTEGTFMLEVEVQDDRGATARRQTVVKVGAIDWEQTTTSDVFDSYVYTEGAIVAGHPAVLMRIDDGDMDRIFYQRADNPEGTSWPAPTMLVAEFTNFPALHVYPSQLFIADGHPAFFYRSSFDEAIYFLRASDPEGTVWPDVVIVADDDGSTADDEAGQISYGALVNGRPAVMYQTTAGPDTVYVYQQATSPDGSAWGAPHPVVSEVTSDTDTILTLGGLVDAGGHPAVNYVITHSSDDNALSYFHRAVDAAGTDWSAPAQRVGDDDHFVSGLTLIGGRPALNYNKHFDVLDSAPGPLNAFIWAADAAGTSWGQPIALPLSDEVGLSFSGSNFLLRDFQGRPAFTTTLNGVLYFFRATDAEGSTWSALDPVLCSDIGIGNTLILDVGGTPGILWDESDRFGTTGQQKFVRKVP